MSCNSHVGHVPTHFLPAIATNDCSVQLCCATAVLAPLQAMDNTQQFPSSLGTVLFISIQDVRFPNLNGVLTWALAIGLSMLVNFGKQFGMGAQSHCKGEYNSYTFLKWVVNPISRFV